MQCLIVGLDVGPLMITQLGLPVQEAAKKRPGRTGEAPGRHSKKQEMLRAGKGPLDAV